MPFMKSKTERRDADRAFLAQNKARYKELSVGRDAEAQKLLGTLLLWLSTVAPDDPPQKAHWAVAQCLAYAAKYRTDGAFMREYEQKAKKIREFDQERAAS